MSFSIAILKDRVMPAVGDIVFDEDLWEFGSMENGWIVGLLAPCKVLEHLENGNILVEEQNEDDAIPEYTDKIRELKFWFVPRVKEEEVKEKKTGFVLMKNDYPIGFYSIKDLAYDEADRLSNKETKIKNDYRRTIYYHVEEVEICD